MTTKLADWGEASVNYDEIKSFVTAKDLSLASEAETRFKVIDRMLREVLGWEYGQIIVEEKTIQQEGYVDYILRDGDNTIVVEAKKYGATFPNPTSRKTLKISGSVLGTGEVKQAIDQAHVYALEKKANVVVVTNARCWIFYTVKEKNDTSDAFLLFPFDKTGQAEQLYNYFAVSRVTAGSLNLITATPLYFENRLLQIVKNADYRVDRNSIANAIAPAINIAILSDSLFENPTSLEKCFVSTEARTKFDSMLNMYLADPKPDSVSPAKRIKQGKKNNELALAVSEAVSSSAPPVTLLLGSVGSGKSTFLKHFELVSGKETLEEKKIHWIYVDFEKMGRTGNPRQFIYDELLRYIESNHQVTPITYRDVIEPAYKDKIDGLRRTRFASMDVKSEKFKDAIYKEIDRDYKKVEPYVDRILKYVSTNSVCVVVLDNVDLYEDVELETVVFAEGLALSKRIFCNVIVSLRDTTFVKHQSDSTFDAYQLQRLWLNPPDFKEVVSSRLTYSKYILKDKVATISLSNGMSLYIPDLSVFFEIVQKSVLNQESGDFITAISDLNVRKGLNLLYNFLTSGHINADTAIKNFLQEDKQFIFPFHEVFKGVMLSQWKYFQEAKSQYCVNLFDARLASNKLQLLRLHLLKFLTTRAQKEQTLEVNVQECIETFSAIGVSERRLMECLGFLFKQALVRTNASEEISSNSVIFATRSAGYYVYSLAQRFVYVEAVLYDTGITNSEIWERLADLTQTIESQSNILERMINRKTRMEVFLAYLQQLEDEVIPNGTPLSYLKAIAQIQSGVIPEVDDAVKRSRTIIKRQLQ